MAIGNHRSSSGAPGAESSAPRRPHAPETVGALMEPPVGVLRPETSIAEAVESLRAAVKTALVTYLHVVDDAGRLVGVVVMREMLLARPQDRLADVMIREPFRFRTDTPLSDAMREAVQRHYPAYPVVDADDVLVGLVRGEDLFRHKVYQLVVQAGSMVGVEKEERLATTWPRALRLRNPWLLVNLATALVAGAVVGAFEETIGRVVALAAFLPVLAGQAGNTGCQALAVTLRGMSLGELAEHRTSAVAAKEAFLGAANGVVVGALAGALMVWVAADHPQALMLGAVVAAAMAGSCLVSGVCGALVPVALDRLGADPATASSIFLTTITDVVSMGLLLGMASAFLV